MAADEGVRGPLVRGLRDREPDLDLVRVQDFGLSGAADPIVLQWALSQGRILITSYRKTVIRLAARRITHGLAMPGLFVLRQRTPLRMLIDDILLAAECYGEEECADSIRFFPLD